MYLSKANLEKVLEAAERIKIAVIGDICLDRYVLGDMVGISREAPIPIINILSDEYLPGGAGNTTLNGRGLGCQLYPISVLGDDLAADIISREFKRRSIHEEFLVRDSGRHTQSYTKVYASCYRGPYQQSARFDQKNYSPISQQSESCIRENLKQAAGMVDAIIVADYAEVAGTGIITDALFDDIRSLAKSGRVIMIGDSRERVGSMRHFTAIVPNDVEVAMTLYPNDYQTRPFQDEKHAAEYALALQKMTECRYVISTRGEKGALIAEADGRTTVVPTEKAEGAIDVTGAGDCFAATLAAALVARLDIIPAVRLANLAAGITVKKLNTTGIATPDEIRAAYAVTSNP
ncbi:hypothetical protein GX408_02730 [bacterium]|nr:hypothetical protein [bacterium]